MKNVTTLMMIVAIVGLSCSTSSIGIFGKKTPHEKYADKLDDNDLEDTPEGRQWLAASKTALEAPQTITLPYKQHGYFAPDKARALGLKFSAKRGERITFGITNKDIKLALYADLFKEDGSKASLVHAADTAATDFSFDVEEAGSFILRLQPELLRTGEYSLSVSVGPSIGFPVSGTKAKAGSFWGASREGGKRKHEGIDIFAPKGTPVVASGDGVITGVKEGGIGGKVVWLRLADKNITLYYAHLDKQLVQEGQPVKKGDVLGLVGNTGNAKHTPSHLHFGIYTSAGPIDPWTFVNPSEKVASTPSKKKMSNYLRLTKPEKLYEGKVVAANTLLVPVAVHSKGYISELPDGVLVQVPFTAVQTTAQQVKQSTGLVSTSSQTATGKM